MTRINVGIAPTNLPDELLLAELRGEDNRKNKPKSEGIQEKMLELLRKTNQVVEMLG
jgi:hypothetical protein